MPSLQMCMLFLSIDFILAKSQCFLPYAQDMHLWGKNSLHICKNNFYCIIIAVYNTIYIHIQYKKILGGVKQCLSG
uniref:Secreted protein n=2 Tax=Anguilla anguilla TaxID=7936 RepID=A0A0E9TZK1_ANGAN